MELCAEVVCIFSICVTPLEWCLLFISTYKLVKFLGKLQTLKGYGIGSV